MRAREPERKPLFKTPSASVFGMLLMTYSMGAVFFMVEAGTIACRYRVSPEAGLWHASVVLESNHLDEGIFPPGEPYAGPFSPDLGSGEWQQYFGRFPLHPNYNDYDFRQVVHESRKFVTLGFAILIGIMWALWFLRLRRSFHAFLWQGLALWGLGILLVFVPEVLNLDYSMGVPTRVILAWTFGIACVMTAVWFILERMRRGISGREYMLAAISPSLLMIYFLPLVVYNGIADARASAKQSQPVYYEYATDGHEFWLLQSTGRDFDFDLDLNKAIQAFEGSVPPSAETMDAYVGPHTYDPSNGILSSGDVFKWGLGYDLPVDSTSTESPE